MLCTSGLPCELYVYKIDGGVLASIDRGLQRESVVCKVADTGFVFICMIVECQVQSKFCKYLSSNSPRA